MKVIFRPKARIEHFETIEWYEKRKTGLGAEFRAEVNTLLLRAIENSGRFRRVTPAIRVGRLPGFPYFVYFSEIANRIEVLAIIYAKRDPKWIRQRLGD